MSDQPPLGSFYEVGGRRLLLHRSGRGRPAVVILPGGWEKRRPGRRYPNGALAASGLSSIRPYPSPKGLS